MLGKVDLAVGQVVAISDMHKGEILQNEAAKRMKTKLVKTYQSKYKF